MGMSEGVAGSEFEAGEWEGVEIGEWERVEIGEWLGGEAKGA